MESVENNANRGFQLKQYETRETNVAAMEEPIFGTESWPTGRGYSTPEIQ